MLLQVALKYTEKYGSDRVRVLTFVKNRGKGGAVRMVSSSFKIPLLSYLHDIIKTTRIHK